jgi:GH15 family glucan-1,4-alpha-glucosidase
VLGLAAEAAGVLAARRELLLEAGDRVLEDRLAKRDLARGGVSPIGATWTWLGRTAPLPPAPALPISSITRLGLGAHQDDSAPESASFTISSSSGGGHLRDRDLFADGARSMRSAVVSTRIRTSGAGGSRAALTIRAGQPYSERVPRDLPLGNGHLLVALDLDGRIRDLYYPRVGHENHAQGQPFRWGFFVDGRFSWVAAGPWGLSRRYRPEALESDLRGESRELGIGFRVRDAVDFHQTVFLRHLVVRNLADRPREVRVFLHHDFRIKENDVGDTVLYDPANRTIVHYKQNRYFLVNVLVGDSAGVPSWACGQRDASREGTWRDAEDGVLSLNPIAQGSVDSTIGVPLAIEAHGEASLYYWIFAARSWDGAWDSARSVNKKIVERGPGLFMERTEAYWRAWVNKEQLNFGGLPPELVDLYKRSLLIVRTQIDEGGAIIAANDSDITQFARDTYSYMWPRDGALVAAAMTRAGYGESARRFFGLCGDLIDAEGYFAHKFTPEGNLASSWHPWTKDGEKQLPIQEDETALVVWALWEYYDRSREIEVFKPLYLKLVQRAADFLTRFRDVETGLPAPSWDLWEERRSVSAFAVGAVLGGLQAAVNFAEGLGDRQRERRWRAALDEIRAAADRHLWRPELGRFARAVLPKRGGEVEVDPVVDVALYGLWAFGGYAVDDPRIVATMQAVERELTVRTPIGGIARYQNDYYHRVTDQVPGNPWFLGMLWLAKYEIALAKDEAALQKAIPRLQWVRERALPSGVLAEQIDPLSGAPLSVSPLTWSHATVVDVVQDFIEKRAELTVCATCGRTYEAKYVDELHIGRAAANHARGEAHRE